jgi:hypothetical protein
VIGQAIGDVLPLALAVAISPIPIIAVILMLLSPTARSTSVGFLFGWLLGIVAAVVVFSLLGSILTLSSGEGPTPVAAVIKIVIGAAAVVLAVGQWRKRPQDGTEPALPKWMSAIDTMKPGASFGLAFLLAAVNPKNLIMAAGAGVVIGTSGLSGGSLVLVTLVYVVVAAITVAVPVIAYLVATDRLRPRLESLRIWLLANNSTVMAVLLLVIGVVSIGKGIGSF